MRNKIIAARIRWAALPLMLVAGVAHADGDTSADTILTNARVYTVEKAQPWAQAVAIRDGRIIAVGSAAQVARTRGKQTRVIDLGGRLVLPSFGDVHVHPMFGGLARSRCPLHDGKTLEDYQAKIASCVAQSPGSGTIYGVGWEDSLFPPNGVPRKEVLDKVSTSRPLIFESVGGHTYWLNSRALEMAGITRDTPNPPNGTIDRDPKTGEPVGGLQEAAMDLAQKLIPPPTPAELQDSILYVAHHFNSMGITNWQDASVEFEDDGSSAQLDAYKVVKDAGKLTAHVSLDLKWKNSRGIEQLPGVLLTADRANKLGITVNTVKFYIDGVIPQKTAYMLAPYEKSGERGSPQIAAATLNRAVTALDERGMQAHMHAIGDGGVRQALDAVEAARKANGRKDTHHMVSHLNVVDPADQPRFARLGAFAQFQPTWSSWYPYMELTETAIGAARMRHIYPAGSIVRAGGRLAYGADWPVGGANPLEGLEIAMTRRTAGDPNAKPLVASEGISLAQAIESYTINVAYVTRQHKVTGSIAKGKYADMVVLDRDIFALKPHEISKAKVLVTLFQGKRVFGDLAALGR